MGDFEEQRAVIKFFAKTGDTPMQCWQKLQQGFGAAAVTPKMVRQWYRRFNSGQTSIKDMPRPGRPKSVQIPENIQKVQDSLQADRRSSLAELSDQVGIKKTSLYSILKKDLKLSKLALKFVPRLLTDEQKRFRARPCQINLDSLKADATYLSRIITGDESWVSVYKVELKKNSREWHPKGTHADRPIKALCNRSEKKVMVTVFFDCRGTVLVDYLTPGETVNTERYCEVLRTLKERVRRKRPDLWGGRNGVHNWLLHHDNAPAHTSVLTLALIGSSGIDMVPHPPYSPDLAPCDFFLFPRLKSALRGHRHRNLRDLKVAINRALDHISPQDYSDAINNLPVRWMKCLKAQGGYFEGRHLAIDPVGDHELEFHYGDTEEDTDSE